MKKIVLILILSFPRLALAGGWTDSLEIEKIQVYGSSDMILVYTKGGSVYTQGCEANRWQITATDAEGRNRVYSTLLAAYMSKQKVAFWYGDTCGLWSYHTSNIINI